MKRCPDLIVLDEALHEPSAGLVQAELQSNPITSSAKIVLLDRPELREA